MTLTPMKTPESELPKSEVPESEIPESDTPESELPKSETPESEIPESEVPESEIPESEVPESETPESEVPESETPESETDAFLALDCDWRVLYQNAEAERLNGKLRSEVLGKTYWEAWPVSVGSELERQYRWAVATQQPVHFEQHFSDPPDDNLWLEVHAYPSPEGLGIFFRDITARKLQEASLQEQQQFIQKIAEAHPGVLYLFDLGEQRNRYLNHRTFELLGYTPEQIYQLGEQFILQVLHPDDQIRLTEHFARLSQLQDGETAELEYQMRHRNGEWRWFWSQDAIFSRSLQGVPQQVLGTALDITDRKQTELALKQSEIRYRSLAELIPQLVWTADAEGNLLDANQRWLEFTGLALTQVRAQGWQEIVHPDDLPHLSQQWAAAQQSSSRYRAEGRIRRADGGYRWHLHQALPLKTEQGGVIRWFGTATDIEDQKQLERQRQELLQREQAAREQAETANRIKDEFLAVLSHELRSPLNPILGWAQLLQQGSLTPNQTQQALTTIARNARLQSELIEDLLDVSRILRGKISLTMAQVNLADTITAALETVRLAAEAKAIQIQSQLAPLTVAGDPARLQQMVWNLLSNAVKFTPQGGRVTVRVEPLCPSAQITVTDTGKGIHPDFLPHVFEYFRQENAATTRQFSGLGLGLAIVRHLVELHGGTITAASPGEGLGATFTIHLPLLPTPMSPQPPTGSTVDLLDLSGTQILVVDDDDDTRDYLAFLLEQAGATVIAVASASAALAVFNQAQPHILLSDIGMPDIDGYMLIRQVRSLSSARQIPAIALTAYAGELNQQQALQAGFQTHLAKPVEPDALIQAIVRLVQSAKKRGPDC
jgi:PAS domain S-box-containing protein